MPDCGAADFSVAVIHDKWKPIRLDGGVRIAWASILSMPYAILSGALPPKDRRTWGSSTSSSRCLRSSLHSPSDGS
jgi:hypothetical protein